MSVGWVGLGGFEVKFKNRKKRKLISEKKKKV